MTKTEHIALWVVVGLSAVGLILNTVILTGELADLRSQVAYATGARPQPDVATDEDPATLPAPQKNTGDAEVWGSQLNVRVLGARSMDQTAVISFTVRGSGSADPLMDLPVLVCGEQAHDVEGNSLETARQHLLDLITQGSATSQLTFWGGPNLSLGCVLVLNPQQDVNSAVAPRIEVLVPQLAPTPVPDPDIEEE
jgi:hypothetical protein